MQKEPSVAAAIPDEGPPDEKAPQSGGAPGYRPKPAVATLVLDLLIVLSRRKRLMLCTTVAAAALAVVIALWLPDRFRASARIMPPQPTQSLAASMIGQLDGLGPIAAMAPRDLGLKNPNDIYVGLLRSRSTQDALIREFDLRQVYRDRTMFDARKDLDDGTTIVSEKAGIITISVEDTDRGRAAGLANAYVEQLRRLTQRLATTEAGLRRLFFEGQLESAKSSLAGAEQALKETEQQSGLIQLDGQAKSIIESLGKLRAAIAGQEVELRAMRLFSTEGNPDLRMRRHKLGLMRQQLARMERRGQEGGEGDIPAGDVSAAAVPEAGLRYVRKVREVKYAEMIFEVLSKQYEAAKLDEAKTAAVIQVLDPAIEPERKISPRRTLIVATSALLAFLGSGVYVVVAAALAQMAGEPGTRLRIDTLLRLVRGQTRLPVAVSAPDSGSQIIG